MDRVRRRKDDLELTRMRRAVDATRAGFETAVPFIAPAISERALQIEIEAGFFRHGADTLAYDSIIASGPNAAVLHHLPTQRLLGAGELVLIDAGAEYRCYDCDVTRTYRVSGDFSAEQADVYALVLRVQRAAIERCRAGVEYRDIHLAAALDVAQGLVDAGFLRGSAAASRPTRRLRLVFSARHRTHGWPRCSRRRWVFAWVLTLQGTRSPVPANRFAAGAWARRHH